MGAAEVGGEGTEPQRQGLVSLGGQSSALGAGSTGVGSAPLGRQGQQAGEACRRPTGSSVWTPLSLQVLTPVRVQTGAHT